MPDLLTWLNAEHLAAQRTYQAQRDPYHEGAVDALDRVIARVEKQAPPDLTPLKELVTELCSESLNDQPSEWRDGYVSGKHEAALALDALLDRLTRALDALEAGR